MKVTEITWSRTYSQNYQSYRAEATAKLEDWETDIDACYDNLKEIVREQIGQQVSSYKGIDSDEVLNLREATQKLKSERDSLFAQCDRLNEKLRLKKSHLKDVENSIRHKGLPMLKQVIAILASNGLTEDDVRLESLLTMENYLEKLDLESLSVDSNNDEENEDDENEDGENEDYEDNEDYL